MDSKMLILGPSKENGAIAIVQVVKIIIKKMLQFYAWKKTLGSGVGSGGAVGRGTIGGTSFQLRGLY
jgi:hypothetical protein